MALHEQSVGKSDEWYTPPHIFEALGCSFDMDVASPGRWVTPWIPAIKFIEADSLSYCWRDFVWMNPPFGGRNGIVPWLERFFVHGNGIALVPDRTSAPWWQQFAPRAQLILFVASKIKFIAGFDDPKAKIERGKPGRSPAQGTCLWSVGEQGTNALRQGTQNGLGILVRPLSGDQQ